MLSFISAFGRGIVVTLVTLVPLVLWVHLVLKALWVQLANMETAVNL